MECSALAVAGLPNERQLWRVNVVHLAAAFLSRINIHWTNVHGTWHRAKGRLRSQLRLQLLLPGWAAVSLIKSSGII